MASRTKYFQSKDVVPDELEARFMNILKAGHDNTSLKPDLEDSEKRWLIIGICLQSVISPILRQSIEPTVTSLYKTMKQNNRIHAQTLKTHCPSYNYVQFNYEAINNNKDLPRIGGRPNVQRYNYNVTNCVDFSKLFIATNMANYTAFDGTMDLSVLLTLIIKINKFPQQIRNIAEQVRTTVRNRWAHCNFDEWDNLQYQTSFQLMFQLIRHLNLVATEESEITDELTKWEENGFKFLQGYVIGQQVITEIKQQIDLMVNYSLKMKSGIDENFTNVHSAMVHIQDEILDACRCIEELTNNQREQNETINVIEKDVGIIKGTVAGLEISHDDTKEKLETLTSSMSYIQSYMSHSKPTGKLFFYPPDRLEYFIGREQELNLIKNALSNKKAVQHTLVICGLGGCGKTALSVEFAWRCQEMYPGGVFWMSAESSETLEDSLTTLAIDVNTTGETLQVTMKKTLKWISNLKDQWLLIIDNADESYLSKHIKELILGTWKRGSKGHIIITTRRETKEAENSIFVKERDCICLNTLSQKEGVLFMIKRTGRDSTSNDDEYVLLLIDKLGGLPLALEQAAAHIKSINCSFRGYLDRFETKRLKLLKAMSSTLHISKERLTVRTTWQMNIDYICEQSENEGLGMAAKGVMEVASFFYSDEIPKELINIGRPVVENKDIVEAFEDSEDSITLNQIIEILTRFSLFNCFHNDTLTVHRLVQEVIVDSMDAETKGISLQSATRMINFAVNSSATPYTLLYGTHRQNVTRGALSKWSKIAVNANVLKEHLFNYSKFLKSNLGVYFNAETLNLLQTTAIFHSLHQRQDKALADQEQMANIIPTLNLEKSEFMALTAVKVPLLKQDREVLQDCIASVIDDQVETRTQNAHPVPLDPTLLKSKGNEAFKSGQYSNAIQYYTEAIRARPEVDIYYKLLSNRSQLYLHIGHYKKALIDANKCIEVAPDHWKAYLWKAYAIAQLVYHGDLPISLEGTGLASASAAAYRNKSCLLDFKMKMNYPFINYNIVDNTHENLYIDILTSRPFTTFLLKKGQYHLKDMLLIQKSVQIIGIDQGVEIITGSPLVIRRPSDAELQIEIDIEPNIHVHFENVFFTPEVGQIIIYNNSIVTFYRCKFSNGLKGCDAYPKCTGGNGCVKPPSCKAKFAKKMFDPQDNEMYGQGGSPGVGVDYGGIAYLHSCVINKCGGGGILSQGDSSFIEIRNCVVKKMRQMGIEARHGGALKVVNNVIVNNQSHGLAIGHRGFA